MASSWPPWWWGTDQVTPGLGGPGRGHHPSILHSFSTFNDRLHCASPGLPLGCPAVTAQPRESHGPCWSLERRRAVVWVRGQGPWETSSGQASGPGRKSRGTQPPSEPALPVRQRPSQGPTAPHTHPGRTLLCLSPTRPRGGQAWPVGPASVCAATQGRAGQCQASRLCVPLGGRLCWPCALSLCLCPFWPEHTGVHMSYVLGLPMGSVYGVRGEDYGEGSLCIQDVCIQGPVYFFFWT